MARDRHFQVPVRARWLEVAKLQALKTEDRHLRDVDSTKVLFDSGLPYTWTALQWQAVSFQIVTHTSLVANIVSSG